MGTTGPNIIQFPAEQPVRRLCAVTDEQNRGVVLILPVIRIDAKHVDPDDRKSPSRRRRRR